jgi:hypothetical protein
VERGLLCCLTVQLGYIYVEVGDVELIAFVPAGNPVALIA